MGALVRGGGGGGGDTNTLMWDLFQKQTHGAKRIVSGGSVTGCWAVWRPTRLPRSRELSSGGGLQRVLVTFYLSHPCLKTTHLTRFSSPQG